MRARRVAGSVLAGVRTADLMAPLPFFLSGSATASRRNEHQPRRREIT